LTAVAQLTEEEAFLWCILSDPTGVDLAEFAWVNEYTPDRCYRLWDFQWPFMQCLETFQIDLLGRGLGKSESLVMCALTFPFNNPAQDMLIATPQAKHMKLITDAIEKNLNRSRIYREMLPVGRKNGITYAPQFQLKFINDAKVITRLAGIDGKGLKGPHPIQIEMDEGQDIPEPAYMEIIETIKVNAPNARWRIHGVSNGTRDMHYKLTHGEGSDLPFYVHRYQAMHRPDWNDTERRNKLAIYGGTEEHPDYVRNIFGEPSDLGNALFVTARLMACVAMSASPADIAFNEDYTNLRISQELIERVGTVEDLMQIDFKHLDDAYSSFWGGMDVGFTNDPSEILIFGTERKTSIDRLLVRVHLERVTAGCQVRVIEHLFDFFGKRLKRFGMDRTGNGLPLVQILKDNRKISARVVGYNFAEKRPVEFDDREPVGKEKPEDLVILKWVKDHATDLLRKKVDTKALRLPYDLELLSEWQGQTVSHIKVSKSFDGAIRKYSGSECHTLDAARMYVLAKELMAIEALLAKPGRAGPVLDRFF